jgi:hypothetical protein
MNLAREHPAARADIIALLRNLDTGPGTVRARRAERAGTLIEYEQADAR